jgi:endoglucanase
MRLVAFLPILAYPLFIAFVLGACATSAPPTGESSSPPADAATGGGSAGTGHDAQASTGKGAGPSMGSAPEAGPSAAGGGYPVSGPTVLDASGKAHLFRGLARPSLEWNSAGDQLSEGDYQIMAQWGANVVRVSLNQDFWLQSDANGTTNPSYDPTYAATVDQQVQWAEQYKLDVILDLHWSDQGNFSVESQCRGTTTGCQQVMADQHSVLFWQQVATKYKGDPHVLFELYNEPNIGGYQPAASDWPLWLNGGQTNGFQAVGMQELYNTVRMTAGAPNLVIIGGLSWAFDLSGVGSTPVNGTNILYATHPYQTDAQNTWTAKFGSLSAKYPIIATEFGDRSGLTAAGQTAVPPACPTAYTSSFIAYANKKSSNGDNPSNELSWTAWAFYVAMNECTFPTLLDSWWTPNAPGTVVQNALMAGP